MKGTDMTTDTRTTHHRVPMDRLRKTALAAGVLYLATFVFSIPAAFGFYDAVLNDNAFVLGAGSSGGVAWGAMFEIITALTGIATAVVLYPVVKRYGENAALGFVASRTLEAMAIFVGVLCVLSVATLRQDLAGTDATVLTTAAHTLLAVKSWTFLIGPGIMPAINALCIGSLMYRSRLIPRIIPTVGLIGAPLLIAAAIGVLFGLHDQVSASSALLTAPIALWELSFGVWMTVKGFNVVRGTADATVGTAAPAFSGAAA
jgi:hypothetical protein